MKAADWGPMTPRSGSLQGASDIQRRQAQRPQPATRGQHYPGHRAPRDAGAGWGGPWVKNVSEGLQPPRAVQSVGWA